MINSNYNLLFGFDDAFDDILSIIIYLCKINDIQ
jgi:hypothetical protein